MAPPRDLRSRTVMFSSPPPLTHDHQPLPVIGENLQRLGVRTKREFEQSLKEYIAAQALNWRGYAAQGERERKTWEAEKPDTYQRREGVGNCRVDGMRSPLLKARVHLRKKEREQETSRVGTGGRAPIQINKDITGPDEDGGEVHQRTNVVTRRANGKPRTQNENEDDYIREENERNKSQYFILNDTH